MSRYMDIKKLKLKEKDKEIFVMRLARGRALQKSGYGNVSSGRS